MSSSSSYYDRLVVVCQWLSGRLGFHGFLQNIIAPVLRTHSNERYCQLSQYEVLDTSMAWFTASQGDYYGSLGESM